MTDINLNFVGPFTFLDGSNCLFRSPLAASSGVYLWTIKQDFDNTHLIHYVGETAAFGKRHKEHLIHILGLNYGIFDPDKARQGVCELLWKGLWRDKTADGPPQQLQAYQRVHQDVVRYLSVLNVFFAELEVEKYLRKHIEGCIGWHLRNNHQEHKALYPDDTRIGTKKEKNRGNLRITMPEVIRGLDAIIPY
jgi:hypothetical protein